MTLQNSKIYIQILVKQFKEENGDHMPVYLNIIDVLGSRLYSGKVSWLREYVQNSIDAGSSKITLRLKDKDLVVEDDGEGISYEKLEKEAFSPGGSSKDPSQIGELGVGLFAGTGICEQIRLITKKKGESAYQATFNAKKYREIVEKDRSALFDSYINSIYTITNYEEQFEPSAQFTKLMLINIDDSALKALEEEVKGSWWDTGMRGYLEKTLDLPISDNFPLKEKIESVLVHEGGPEFTVSPKININVELGKETEELRKFMFINGKFIDYIYCRIFRDKDEKPLAKIWAAYSKDGLEIDGSRFLVKFKGMTVGDDKTVAVRTQKRVERRILGEAIALSDELKVNTERDWFVETPKLAEFMGALNEAVSELFSISNDDSTKMRSQIKLENENAKLEKELEKLNPKSTAAKDKKKSIEKNNEALKGLREDAERRVENFTVGKTLASDSAKKLIKEIYEVRKKTIESIREGKQTEASKKTQQEDKITRVSPVPRTVKNFLTEQIVDQGLREKIRKKDDVKDLANNAFTYIEVLLKTKRGRGANEHVDSFKKLVDDFSNRYDPPATVPEKERGDFMRAFKEALMSAHYFWRNPSAHSFMEEQRDDRFLFQVIMVSDFVTYLINSCVRKVKAVKGSKV